MENGGQRRSANPEGGRDRIAQSAGGPWERGDREAAQLEQDIRTKKEQAEKAREVAKEAAPRQGEIQKLKEEVEGKIAGFKKQLLQEQTAAQNDEARAQQARIDGASATAQRTTVGALAGAVQNTAAAAATNSAAAHRVRAGQLQNQILDLNRQLESLNNGVLPAVKAPAPTPPPDLGPGLQMNKLGEILAFNRDGLESLRNRDQRKYEMLWLGGETSSIEKRFYFVNYSTEQQSDGLYLLCNFGFRDPNGKWKDYRRKLIQPDKIVSLKDLTGYDYQVVFTFTSLRPDKLEAFAYLSRPKDDPGVLKRGRTGGKR